MFVKSAPKHGLILSVRIVLKNNKTEMKITNNLITYSSKIIHGSNYFTAR